MTYTNQRFDKRNSILYPKEASMHIEAVVGTCFGSDSLSFQFSSKVQDDYLEGYIEYSCLMD